MKEKNGTAAELVTGAHFPLPPTVLGVGRVDRAPAQAVPTLIVEIRLAKGHPGGKIGAVSKQQKSHNDALHASSH